MIYYGKLEKVHSLTSLNPCFGGSWVMILEKVHSLKGGGSVLILVLVEVGL